MVEKQKMVFFGSWFHTRGCYMIGYGPRNGQKFLEDWVASLQLRPRICQLYVQTAEIAHNFMKPNPYRNDDTISQKYPISFWSKSHVPIPSTYK